MKVLKVVYDDNTISILDIIQDITVKVALETYNINDYKQKKKALPIMTRHGTTNVPLLVFADENLDEYAAIWSESTPNWVEAIIKILND